MIQQINILDMIKMYGEDSCKAVLSTFMCPLNLDVEDFIHNLHRFIENQFFQRNTHLCMTFRISSFFI